MEPFHSSPRDPPNPALTSPTEHVFSSLVQKKKAVQQQDKVLFDRDVLIMVRHKNRYLVVEVHTLLANASFLQHTLLPKQTQKQTKTKPSTPHQTLHTPGSSPSSEEEHADDSPGQTQRTLGLCRGVPPVASAIADVLKSCFGSCLSGQILISFQVRAYDLDNLDLDLENEEAVKKVGGEKCALCLRCVVRCDREHQREVRAAIAMVTTVAGCRAALTVTKVKGSQRTLADALISRRIAARLAPRPKR